MRLPRIPTVINPEAIGDPNATPIVQLPPMTKPTVEELRELCACGHSRAAHRRVWLNTDCIAADCRCARFRGVVR